MTKVSLVFCFLFLATSRFAYGSIKKKDIKVFDIKKGDISLKVTNYGATILSLVLPDKNGKLGDVILAYRSLMDYTESAYFLPYPISMFCLISLLYPCIYFVHSLVKEDIMNDTSYFGATVGRVGNRIAGAQFTLNGIHYKLPANEGNNTLHGGKVGFSDVLWKVKKYQREGPKPSITFTYHSFDGEEGFPGDFLVRVSYTLYGKNQMSIIMKAKALNKPTPVNLLNHAYWNLGGHNSGDILNEQVQIFGSKTTPLDSHLIPTGKFASVKGTPYDFLKPHVIGSRIKHVSETNGYNVNYVIDGKKGKINRAAIAYDNKSGRAMAIWTNAPGVQFYTSNYLGNVKGKNGAVYKDHGALCLETQAFPDSVNHPNFPSTIVSPGKDYKHYMFFKFSAKAPHGFT